MRLVAAMLAGATFAAAEVYKWVDSAGRTHYGDSPPAAAAQAARRLPVAPAGPAATADARAVPAARAAVRLYTASWCGYCKRAKAHLRARGVPFEEFDVERSVAVRQEYDRLGGRGVPIILVGQQRMDGFDATTLDAMLARAGY